MTPFHLARLSLLRHLFSTMITVVAIALSVACGGVLLRLYETSQARFSTFGSGGDAVVGAKAGGIEILLNSLGGEGKFPDFLPYKLFESLRAEQAITHSDGVVTRPNYIDSVIPIVYFAFYKDYRVLGTDDSFFKRPNPNDTLIFKEGRDFANAGEVVLGSAVAQKEGFKVGDTVTVRPWLGDRLADETVELRVSGILMVTNTQWDRTLFSSVSQAQTVFAAHNEELRGRSIWGPQVLHYFLIYLKPHGMRPLEELINRRTVAQVIDIREQKNHLQELTGLGKSLGLFITAFVLALGALAVCSVLVTRFEGMSAQLAVLRALGYTRKEISRWLLWEGFLLGLAGVVLGAFLDALLFPGLRSLLGTALPPAELVSSSIFESAGIWGMALLATLLAVIAPAIKMNRQDPHNALRE